jgi:hypothetical protein
MFGNLKSKHNTIGIICRMFKKFEIFVKYRGIRKFNLAGFMPHGSENLQEILCINSVLRNCLEYFVYTHHTCSEVLRTICIA